MKSILGKVDKTIFGSSVVVYSLIFLFILCFPKVAEGVVNSVLNFTLSTVGWVYILAYAFIIISFLIIGLSKYGKIKLGQKDAQPEYSFFSWMGMLFGAGLGVGLVFYGVTEPVSHFMAAPFAQSGTAEAAADAMRTTFFHWSFLPWSSYGIVGLCLGYFIHCKGLPGLISSTFQPMLGTRIKGIPGKVIDSFSLIALICGISMSVGFAATQLTSGLSLQYGVPNSFLAVTSIIIIIGALGTASAMRGIAKGVKIISDVNMYIVIFFVAFTLIFGSTVYLINTFFQSLGNTVFNLPWMLFFTDSFEVVSSHTGFDWVESWTVFYWAWWVAFAPFVGGFLARISKGRTIKEFVLACVFVPGLLCCLWFTLFGGEAIHMTLFEGSDVCAVVASDINNSLFVFLRELPLSGFTVPLSIILIITLIVTSVNSSTYVAGTLSSGGNAEPSLGLRGFWGVFIALNAILFFSIGGLDTLKNTAIVFAFPFIIIIVFMVINLFKELKTCDLEEK
ncbi:MAG: BCCT family transporter [Bacillota bacterium]|nr:BCCT family transporter [Bacillota bacterium]